MAPHTGMSQKEAFMIEGMTEEEADLTIQTLRPEDLATLRSSEVPHDHTARNGEGAANGTSTWGHTLTGRGTPPHLTSGAPADRGRRDNFNHRGNTRNEQGFVGSPSPQEGHQKVRTFKPEDVGLFDGKTMQYSWWVVGVTTLIEQRPSDEAWHQAILEVLPQCLRDSARQWYLNLDPGVRFNMKTWRKWVEEMDLAFKPNAAQLADLADERIWHDDKEDTSAYFFDKMSRCRAANPHSHPNDFVGKIVKGLPDVCHGLIRTHLSFNPDARLLLNELRGHEGALRKAIAESKRLDDALRAPRQIRNAGQTITTITPSPQVTSGSSTAVVTKPNETKVMAARRFNVPDLKSTFDPALLFKENNITKYRIPGTNEVMSLNRPCRLCQGQHWDWMHDLIPPKGAVNFIETETYWVETVETDSKVDEVHFYELGDTDRITEISNETDQGN